MSCKHKFSEYLNLEKIDDFLPTTLVVGTFNPAWPSENYAEWFYGRTSNNYFWDVLPRLYNLSGMRKQFAVTKWKEFCVKYKIAITDLIEGLEDADPNSTFHRNILRTYSDTTLATKFKRPKYINIVSLLEKHKTIQQVYLTTTAKLWDRQWETIVDYCRANGIRHQRLLTPSKGARFFMKKGSGIKLHDFIFRNWQEKWHKTENSPTTNKL